LVESLEFEGFLGCRHFEVPCRDSRFGRGFEAAVVVAVLVGFEGVGIEIVVVHVEECYELERHMGSVVKVDLREESSQEEVACAAEGSCWACSCRRRLRWRQGPYMVVEGHLKRNWARQSRKERMCMVSGRADLEAGDC
jgi:hypothetical protein